MCAPAIVAAKAVSGKVGCTNGTEQVPGKAFRETNDMAAKTSDGPVRFLDWVFSLARGPRRLRAAASGAGHDRTGDNA